MAMNHGEASKLSGKAHVFDESEANVADAQLPLARTKPEATALERVTRRVERSRRVRGRQRTIVRKRIAHFGASIFHKNPAANQTLSLQQRPQESLRRHCPPIYGAGGHLITCNSPEAFFSIL
jgi:hypothetical protein